MTSQEQLALFGRDSNKENVGIEPSLAESRTGSFVDNMKLPVHGWFRYSAGFSGEWAESVIRQREPKLGVLDPFAGSATTLLASEKCRVPSAGFEPHPFVYEIARAKLSWAVDPTEFYTTAHKVLDSARTRTADKPATESPLLLKCYESESLAALEALRYAYEQYQWLSPDDPLRRLVWIALTSILRECSIAGTATWQYILPNKKKTNPKNPFRAFSDKISRMAGDIGKFRSSAPSDNAEILLTDARMPTINGRSQFDLVVTSPPYPNNYDYADATRLEMTFWGIVSSWGDLHGAARRFLLRSCSQHTAKEKLQLKELLAEDVLCPIQDEISKVCGELERVREQKGGKKTYHTMVAAYFVDLAKIFRVLRELCVPGSQVCYVIGDSAPYGVYVPTDKWLGDLAVHFGFQGYEFEQIRARNTKWKNRKHRVPLKEGNLWIKG